MGRGSDGQLWRRGMAACELGEERLGGRGEATEETHGEIGRHLGAHMSALILLVRRGGSERNCERMEGEKEPTLIFK